MVQFWQLLLLFFRQSWQQLKVMETLGKLQQPFLRQDVYLNTRFNLPCNRIKMDDLDEWTILNFLQNRMVFLFALFNVLISHSLLRL